MSFQAALQSRIVAIYVGILFGILIGAAIALAALQRWSRRDMRAVWVTYRSWLWLTPLVIGAIVLGRGPTILLFTVLSLLGVKEFARATGLYQDWWMTGAVYLAILAVGLIIYVPNPHQHTPGWFGFLMAMPVYAIQLFTLIPILRNRTRGQLQMIALAVLAFVYLGWMFLHLAYLANSSNAYGYLLYLLVAVELNDVSAFTFGRLLGKRGRHLLRSAISPGKTWEGSLGALAVSMGIPWLLHFSFPYFGPLQLILTGLIVGIGGQLGDLSISVIKRDLGIKDMGKLLPGHGGILDRIDSLIYTAPLFLHMVNYYYGLQ